MTIVLTHFNGAVFVDGVQTRQPDAVYEVLDNDGIQHKITVPSDKIADSDAVIIEKIAELTKKVI